MVHKNEKVYDITGYIKNRILTAKPEMPKLVGITSSDDLQSWRKKPAVQRSERSTFSKSFSTHLISSEQSIDWFMNDKYNDGDRYGNAQGCHGCG